MRAHPRSDGFTLLELLVVIFIVSLVAAIVFPALRTDTGRLREDAKKVSSILRYISDSAIATKHTYTIKFDIDKHIIEWEGPEGKKTQSISTLQSVEVKPKGTIKEGEVKLYAGPDGFEDFIEVTLLGEETKAIVKFNPISGRTKIEER